MTVTSSSATAAADVRTKIMTRWTTGFEKTDDCYYDEPLTEILTEKNPEHIDLFPPKTMDLSSAWAILQQALVMSSFRTEIFIRSAVTRFRRSIFLSLKLDLVQPAEEKGKPALKNTYGVDRVALSV